MRTLISFCICFLLLASANGQANNQNYFKLIVLNEEGDKMLLVNFKDQWEPAGRRYDSESSISTVLNEMAAEMGVVIKDHRLRAMITKYYGKATHPIIFNYVTAQYQSGDLQVPPGCKDIRWYTAEEAVAVIPFEGMRMVMQQVFLEGTTGDRWGGSLHITTDPVTKRKSATVLEDFYLY